MKKLVSDAGLQDQYFIDSCGTSGNHQGEGADPRTVQNALKNGLSFSHCARKLQPEDLGFFDLILTMERYNFRDAEKMAAKHGIVSGDIRMMRSFDPLSPDPEADVPDPWYGVEEDFEEVFQILHRSCAALLENLRSGTLKGEIS